MNNTVKWTVSLSSGETIYEGKGDYKHNEGELSPWQKLKKHKRENDLKITSLALYTDKNQRWNLPSAGDNPKFSTFDKAEEPKSFKFRRKMAADVLQGGEMVDQKKYAMIEAEYGEYKLQTWVSIDGKASWSLIL